MNTHQEDDLRKKLERLEFALSSTSLGLWDWNIETDEIHYDSYWADMLGYSLDELKPDIKTWEGLVHPDDIEIAQKALQDHIEEKTPFYETELRMKTKSGNWLWISDRGKVVEWNAEGKPTRLTGTHRDIHASKEAENALKESEKRLHQIIDLVPHCIFARDNKGRFILANKAYADAFGTTFSNLIGHTLSDFHLENTEFERLHNEDMEIIEKGTAKFFGIETITLHDGRKRLFQTTKIPYLVSGSREPAVLGVSTDITEKVNAEAALQNSEELNRGIVENVPLGLMYLDINGIIIFNNKIINDIISVNGESQQAIIGKSVFELDVLQESGFNTIVDRLFAGELISETEISLQAGNNERIEIRIYGAPRHDIDGNIDGAIIICMDITEFKELEKQFIQSQKMEAVGRLVSGISHDFNNFLTAISGQAELAALAVKETEPAYLRLQEIIKTSVKASTLIRQLLDLSKGETLAPIIINLNLTIREMKYILDRSLGEFTRLELDLDQNLLLIKADSAHIDQIILNLVVNSRDSMPDGGLLHIKTENIVFEEQVSMYHSDLQPGSYVALSITDTGHGMSPEVQGRIFDPFYTTKPSGKGSGLGLSTVYGITKQNGGHILVSSEERKGTTVQIFFPSVEESYSDQIEESDGDIKTIGAETILVAEDDDEVREIIVDSLKEFGYNVLEAVNGKVAFDLCESLDFKIDILLLDVVMPELSGPEMVEHLLERKINLKRLFMSGYPLETMVSRKSLSKDDPYIQKPFSPSDLAQRIREILDE
ncbi:MAG: PAS domain S-box protein [Candidatus Electryonea clarkiae]|nr:PAS domain S-box protein [Candidatus Electryonea clarkiae]MDP8285502.1 PAS domain S-box protein [Candidatus Electryonea clarkiae]